MKNLLNLEIFLNLMINSEIKTSTLKKNKINLLIVLPIFNLNRQYLKLKKIGEKLILSPSLIK